MTIGESVPTDEIVNDMDNTNGGIATTVIYADDDEREETTTPPHLNEQEEQEPEHQEQRKEEKSPSILLDLKRSIGQYVNLLLHNRKYMWLFLSGIISVTGNFLSQIAIYSIIEERTSKQAMSGLSVSAISWCIFIPPVLLVPFSGVTADLFDQRYIMLASDLLRALLVPLFLLVSWFNLSYFILYGVLAAIWAVNAFFDPCKDSLVPVVVKDKSDILVAKSLDSLTWMFCSFVGSSLGGLITSVAGPSANFIVDAITFLASSFCVYRLCKFPDFFSTEEKPQVEEEQVPDSPVSEIELRQMSPIEENGDEVALNDDTIDEEQQKIETLKKSSKLRYIAASLKNYFFEMMQGFLFLIKHPYLLSLCLLKSSGALCWASFDIISLKYSDSYFRIGNDASAMLGITKALSGLSSGLTPVIVERTVNLILRRRKRRRLEEKRANGEEITPNDENMDYILWDPRLTRAILVLSYLSVVSGFALVLVSAKKHVVPFLLAHIMIGIGGGTVWVLSTSSIYLVCPGKYMGRVMSVDFGFFHSSAVILCITASGIIYDRTGSITTLVIVMMILMCSVALMWTIWAILLRNKPHVTIKLETKEELLAQDAQ